MAAMAPGLPLPAAARAKFRSVLYRRTVWSSFDEQHLGVWSPTKLEESHQSGHSEHRRNRRQIGTILTNAPGVQQGYAQVRRTACANPFVTYAVINDGAGLGEQNGEGAYIGSSD